MSAPDLLTIRITHGEIGAEDIPALDALNRTVHGMLHHGFISKASETIATGTTTWHLAPGNEDLSEVRKGFIDVLNSFAPEHWNWEIS